MQGMQNWEEKYMEHFSHNKKQTILLQLWLHGIIFVILLTPVLSFSCFKAQGICLVKTHPCQGPHTCKWKPELLQLQQINWHAVV